MNKLHNFLLASYLIFATTTIFTAARSSTSPDTNYGQLNTTPSIGATPTGERAASQSPYDGIVTSPTILNTVELIALNAFLLARENSPAQQPSSTANHPPSYTGTYVLMAASANGCSYSCKNRPERNTSPESRVPQNSPAPEQFNILLKEAADKDHEVQARIAQDAIIDREKEERRQEEINFELALQQTANRFRRSVLSARYQATTYHGFMGINPPLQCPLTGLPFNHSTLETKTSKTA